MSSSDCWVEKGSRASAIHNVGHACSTIAASPIGHGHLNSFLDEFTSASTVEEMTVHYLAAQMPPGLTVCEVPLSQGESSMPLCFRLAIEDDGITAWRISHDQSPFEGT